MPEPNGDAAADGTIAVAMGPGIHLSEGSSSIAPRFDEETSWELNFGAKEAMEAGPYPERPGEQDCSYYIRTGLCRFGMTCRFNHPLNRKLAAAAARIKGGYPERVGQPECQYYLKTGTCKFGATCKFHHPKDKAGIAGRAQLNSIGYPLRPNEIECSYYLRTGQCKFGNTCKFHHPEPSNTVVPFRGSPIYPTVHSPTTPGQQSYSGITNWPISRASYMASPRWQSTSSYAQVIVPQSMMPVPGWNAYPGQHGSVSSSENQQQTPGNGQLYGSSQQNETTNTSTQGAFSPYCTGSIPMGLYAMQRENVFPERPGEPECMFYMKTGDCKFGSVCRFHHPRERLFPVPDCVLSPLGLPLRPGEPLCIFYSRYGVCKFGPNCKFDHPMGTLMYGVSPSSASPDAPITQPLLSPSSGTAGLPLSSEGNEEEGEENPPQHLKSSPQGASGKDNEEADGPSSIIPVSSFS